MVEYNKINNYIEVIVLIIAYILGFIFINIENTEQISIYLFLILHILFLFIYFFTKNNWATINIPLVFIFVIGWTLILVSLSLVINTFRILHNKYYPDPINFGRNIHLKEIIKNIWVASTVLLWILFFYIKQNIALNTYNILLSISIIILSSVNIYLSYTFAKKQYTIAIPN